MTPESHLSAEELLRLAESSCLLHKLTVLGSLDPLTETMSDRQLERMAAISEEVKRRLTNYQHAE